MLHQWFTCVHLLDTYLANLTEGFQLSFTTHQFPSEQHKVVCNQHLHAECGGSATISLEVTAEIYQIKPISDFILSQDTLFASKDSLESPIDTWVYKSCHLLMFYMVVDAILHFCCEDTLFY